jgi:hypothetical protein
LQDLLQYAHVASERQEVGLAEREADLVVA